MIQTKKLKKSLVYAAMYAIAFVLIGAFCNQKTTLGLPPEIVR